MNRSVAIVGRPNVGKSRLFNRLAKKRISIVHDQPGVTRDVITAEIEDGAFTLMDTGGLGFTDGNVTPAALTTASELQVGFAIASAQLILFVIDGLAGLTSLDTRIGQMLRKSKKDVLLVINKADFDDSKVDKAEAYRLGLGEPFLVSAEHGTGESYLREEIIKRLGPLPEETETKDKTAADPLCVCFIGRPNVGKSSLSNRLLQSDRLIVSNVPGTTRDAVSLPFDFKGRDGRYYPFKLIDTAGIKASTKLASPVEYFSRLRSLDAIKETDVVFLVLDAIDGVTQQDKAIAGEAIKERKPIVIVINKWDIVQQAFKKHLDPDCAPEWGLHDFKTEREYRLKYERAILANLFFTPGAPLIFVSAMNGYEVDRMLNAAVKLHRILDIKLPTAKLNKVIGYLTERTPPPAVGGKRFRVYYATQTGNRPFRIKIFCNREEKLTEQYRRYLEAGLVDAFELNGCPMYFELVGKEKHEEGAPYSGKAKRAALAHARRELPESHIPKWKEGEKAAYEEDSKHETLED